MTGVNFLLISIILLSSALANAFLLDNIVSSNYLVIQIGYAANELNQTSSEVNNCDASSACTTFPDQNARIESGDRNQIVQDLSQVNQMCIGASTCTDVGFQGQRMGETEVGDIVDEGTNNNNVQTITNDESSYNDNTGIQRDVIQNQECLSEAGCSNLVADLISIGPTRVGRIVNLGPSDNNDNIQTNNNMDSNNKNSVLHDSSFDNNKCKNESVCTNFVNLVSFIGFTDTGAIFNDIGNSNTNIQKISVTNSSNSNQVTGKMQLLNRDCDSTDTVCFNFGIVSSDIGIGSDIVIFNEGDNNTNTQLISVEDSNSENKIDHNVKQTTIGCAGQTICGNNVFDVTTIGLSSNAAISSQGDNNNISQVIILNKSNNNNNVQKELEQQNSYCEVGSSCSNIIGSVVFIGTSTTTSVDNIGNNNIISSVINNTNSNNNNEIEQISKQTNSHCSSSSCVNTAVINTELGLAINPSILNSENNTSFIQSESNVNTNNNNKISQELDQSNLCRTSQCVNTGNLSATIDGENNKQVDQSLNQDNLCLTSATCNNDGKVIDASGSNSQTNTCLGDASCSNSGTNNKNICTNGASCTNAGTNTKVVSNGDPCAPETDNSITICNNGRIITRPT